MFLLTDNPSPFNFQSDFFQLLALIITGLTNVSLIIIPAILKEKRKSLLQLQKRLEDYKAKTQQLDIYIQEFREIKIICESIEDSKGFFSNTVGSVEMTNYCQNKIHQIQTIVTNTLAQNDNNVNS